VRREPGVVRSRSEADDRRRIFVFVYDSFEGEEAGHQRAMMRDMNNRRFGSFLALGVAIGAGIGVALHNLPIGVGVGAAMGSVAARRPEE